MDLKILNIRFSRDYFQTFEDCAKWMDAKNIEIHTHVALDKFFVFNQIEKEKFADNSIQEYKLDSGVVAEVGLLKPDPIQTIDGVTDTETVEPEEANNEVEVDELTSLKATQEKQAQLINNLLDKLTNLIQPINDLKQSINKKAESAESVHFNVPIIKANDEEQTVYGEVLVPNETDAQGHIYSELEVAKAAHFWMKEFSQLGHMHKDMLGESQISILETYIAPTSFKFSEADEREVKKGTWLLKVFVEDPELWIQVKEGKLNGFSIGGVATVEDFE